MRLSLLLGLLGLAAPGVGWAVENASALTALRLLPPEAAARVTFMAGFEGAPEPERWHIVVHDPAEESGVHEYVVAGGELVASRSVSQFAEEVRPTDVLGTDNLKVDTDRASKLAQAFAKVNRVTVASMNYELKRAGEGAAPLWHVTCLDAKGEELGKLILSAAKGTVISHDGFAEEPTAERTVSTPEREERTERSDRTARAAERPRVSTEEPERRRSEPRRSMEVRRPTEVRPPQVLPAQPVEERRGIFRRFFGGEGGRNDD